MTQLHFPVVTGPRERTSENGAARFPHGPRLFSTQCFVGTRSPLLPSQTRQWEQGSWWGPGTHTWGCCSRPAHTPCHVCSGDSGRGLEDRT